MPSVADKAFRRPSSASLGDIPRRESLPRQSRTKSVTRMSEILGEEFNHKEGDPSDEEQREDGLAEYAEDDDDDEDDEDGANGDDEDDDDGLYDVEAIVDSDWGGQRKVWPLSLSFV